jgi:polysaccharide export outer membrane protein
MKFIRFVVIVALPFYILSCRTQQKIPNYLQDLSDTTGPAEVRIPELKIQKNDLLSIQVYSASTRPEISDAPYNLPGQSSPTGDSGASIPSISGFLVDANGNIEYPQLGVLHVEGLTKQQLAELIKTRINAEKTVLLNPSVIIRFQNLKVTVMGEVNKQGPIVVPGERVTILEAIGLAGGITDYGQKEKVKVVREVDGKRQVGIVDLSSKDLFESPYYNLMQNDMVFIDPSGRKAKRADQEVAFRQAGFVISVITAIAVVIRVFQ